MKKYKVKLGDNVIVISGEHKNQKGKLFNFDKKKNRVFIEGINIVSKHEKPSAGNPQGGIIKKEASIHISNVALIDPKSDKPTRVGYDIKNNKKIRISKKSKEVI